MKVIFIKSSTGQCEHNTVRLVGGNASYEGIVEYCSNGVWGTVCDTFWDYLDAITVCNQLNMESDCKYSRLQNYYNMKICVMKVEST